MQLKWSHALIYVQNMDEMLDFYTNVLGFEVADRGDLGGNGIAFLSQVETDHHQFAFLETRKDQAPSNNVNHFAFRVDDLDDVKAMHATLSSDDRVSNVRPTTHGNTWSVYFSDPEGNGIEIFCDSPWHVAQPQGKPWDTSLDNETVFEQTEAQFAAEPEFGPIEDFYARRAAHLAQREGKAT